ncbi:MAG: hypothetical protein DRI56_03065 [Chloroflexota bacterium]|nr:MAG: hypothetical protein B6243_07855 [Anaerolineaceae bacterium 4572_5.2]RLD10101.1 MAG: hypothetical protein DRI56_03065 [Chloroflexota bacterium]
MGNWGIGELGNWEIGRLGNWGIGGNSYINTKPGAIQNSTRLLNLFTQSSGWNKINISRFEFRITEELWHNFHANPIQRSL